MKKRRASSPSTRPTSLRLAADAAARALTSRAAWARLAGRRRRKRRWRLGRRRRRGRAPRPPVDRRRSAKPRRSGDPRRRTSCLHRHRHRRVRRPHDGARPRRSRPVGRPHRAEGARRRHPPHPRHAAPVGRTSSPASSRPTSPRASPSTSPPRSTRAPSSTPTAPRHLLGAATCCSRIAARRPRRPPARLLRRRGGDPRASSSSSRPRRGPVYNLDILKPRDEEGEDGLATSRHGRRGRAASPTTTCTTSAVVRGHHVAQCLHFVGAAAIAHWLQPRRAHRRRDGKTGRGQPA
jgi:hypothetical protein